MRISLLLLTSLITISSVTAHAAQWLKVRDDKDGTHYFYDSTKLDISGDEIAYWKKVEFKAPKFIKSVPAKTALFRERINCSKHTLQTLSYFFYRSDSTVIDQTSTPNAEATAIIPDSLGDAYEKVMCPIAQSRKKQNSELKNLEDKLQATREELSNIKGQLEALQTAINQMRTTTAISPSNDNPGNLNNVPTP